MVGSLSEKWGWRGGEVFVDLSLSLWMEVTLRDPLLESPLSLWERSLCLVRAARCLALRRLAFVLRPGWGLLRAS